MTYIVYQDKKKNEHTIKQLRIPWLSMVLFDFWSLDSVIANNVSLTKIYILNSNKQWEILNYIYMNIFINWAQYNTFMAVKPLQLKSFPAVCVSHSNTADSHSWLTGSNYYSAIYHAGNLLPLLSPGIKQSPKQINRRPAVVMGAATEPAAHSQPRWLPLQQKSRRWFQPGPFVEVHMGAMIKTAQVTKGVRQPSPSLDSSTTCRPSMGNWGSRGKCILLQPLALTQVIHSIHQRWNECLAYRYSSNRWNKVAPQWWDRVSGIQVSCQACVWNDMFDFGGCLHVSTLLLIGLLTPIVLSA